MNDDKFKTYMEGLQQKAKTIQQMHNKQIDTVKKARDAHSYESQRTGALLAIAEGLSVHNEFQLAGIEEQLKMALELLAEE